MTLKVDAPVAQRQLPWCKFSGRHAVPVLKLQELAAKAIWDAVPAEVLDCSQAAGVCVMRPERAEVATSSPALTLPESGAVRLTFTAPNVPS